MSSQEAGTKRVKLKGEQTITPQSFYRVTDRGDVGGSAEETAPNLPLPSLGCRYETDRRLTKDFLLAVSE